MFHQPDDLTLRVDRLVCPRCRGCLVERQRACACEACATSYPVIDGVVDLLPADSGEIETDYEERPASATWSVRELAVENVFARIRERIGDEAARLGRRLDVLDIGSGGLLRGSGEQGGRFFRILTDHARSYLGIEPSWSMLRQVATPDGNVHHLPSPLLVRSCGEALPVRDRSIDVVFCLSVLDHCVDPDAVVARAGKILRPGGLFVLVLQNDAAWYRSIVRRVAPAYFQRRAEADHHHHRFSPAEARRLFETSGFVETRSEDLGYLIAPGLRHAMTAALYPARALGPARGARLLRAIDRALSRVLPEVGTTFMLEARAGAGQRT